MKRGTRWRSWLRFRYKPENRGFDSRLVHWIFHGLNPSGHIMATLWPHDEYQEYFLGVTADDNLATFVCRFSRYPWCPNLLEPLKTVQACNGVAFYLHHETVFFIVHLQSLHSPQDPF